MSRLYYRLSETSDPEERLEDAALYKALHDEFGDGLTLVPGDQSAPPVGLFLGRGKKNEHGGNVLARSGLRYWEDPAFRDALNREFIVTDLKGALAGVIDLHARGKGAFVKSTKDKHFVQRIDVGEQFAKKIGSMAYSFMDIPDCLIVQEAVEMTYERRFLVMNGRIVTQSPVAWHLTPMSRGAILQREGFNIEDLHYKTPGVRDATFDPDLTKRMTAHAQRIADASETPHLCIDLAVLGGNLRNGQIEVIEFNPMQPGAVGLYACDPVAIASAVADVMSPEMLQTIRARQAGAEDDAENSGFVFEDDGDDGDYPDDREEEFFADM